MSTKQTTPDKMVLKLRQVEVLMGQAIAPFGCNQTDQNGRANRLPLAQAVWGNGRRSIKRMEEASERK